MELLGVMYKEMDAVATTPIELDVLFPGVLVEKLEAHDGAKLRDLGERTRSGMAWSAKDFGIEDSRAASVTSTWGQLGRLFDEIVLRQRDADDDLVNEKGPDVLALSQREEEQLNYERERKEVKARLGHFGLCADSRGLSDMDRLYILAKNMYGTFRGVVLAIVTSSVAQTVSLLGIVGNLTAIWIESEAVPNSDLAVWVNWFQYALTVGFFLEATCYVIAVPTLFKYRSVFFDVVVCYTSFLVDTVRILFNTYSPATILLALRLFKFYRVFARIRRYPSARAARVMVDNLGKSFITLFWISVFLFSVLYCGTIVLRSNFKQILAEEGHDELVGVMIREYFGSFQETLVTLLLAFLQSFDHATRICRPLFDSQYVGIAWFWLGYMYVLTTVTGSLITSVFVEQMVSAAKDSDAKTERDMFLAQGVTYDTIRVGFQLCDTGNAGYIGIRELEIGAEQHHCVRELIKFTTYNANLQEHRSKLLSLFRDMDHRGQGVLTFSEFAYGLLSTLRTRESIDGMLFDQATRELIRQNASTISQLKEAKNTLRQALEGVGLLNRHMMNSSFSAGSKLHLVVDKLGGLKEKVDAISGGAIDTKKTGGSLLNTANVQESKNISKLMVDMKKSMDNAADTIKEMSRREKEIAMRPLSGSTTEGAAMGPAAERIAAGSTIERGAIGPTTERIEASSETIEVVSAERPKPKPVATIRESWMDAVVGRSVQR
jgi:hypothetical protein